MKTYLPRAETLQMAQGLWCVESAWMDRIDEAYYLGGDFGGRGDCCFCYMVWPDIEMQGWFVGHNRHGQLDIPFSSTRCAVLGAYRSLREALDAAEQHALRHMTAARPDLGTRPTPGAAVPVAPFTLPTESTVPPLYS